MRFTMRSAIGFPGISRRAVRSVLLGEPASTPRPDPAFEAAPKQPTAPEQAQLVRKSLPARSGGSILVGLDPDQEPVWWKLDELANAFMGVFGASGSGKSEFLRAAAGSAQIPALVLDFHGDLKGRSATVTPGSVADLNPLEIVAGGPRDQADRFVTSVGRAVPALKHVQKSKLREAVLAVYERAGAGTPTIQDLRNALESRDGKTGNAGLLAGLDGVFSGSPRQRVSLRQLLAQGGRIDLSALSRPAQVLAAETALEQVWGALRDAGALTSRKYRVLLIIDEAVILRGCEVLDTLLREARKFGLALILAAQAPSEVSSAIINNAGAVLQLALGSPQEAKAAARILHSVPSANELQELAEPGDGFFRAGRQVTRVHVLPLQSPERRALMNSE